MPEGKHLKFIIGVDGCCRIDAVNFTGPSCQAATQGIAHTLGGQVRPGTRIRRVLQWILHRPLGEILHWASSRDEALA